MTRYVFAVGWALVLVMIGTALWRLSLSPDWTQISMLDENGMPRPANGMILFMAPLVQALVTAGLWLVLREATGLPEAVQAWRSWLGSVLLVVYCYASYLHASFLLGSFGMDVPGSPGLASGTMFVLAGLAQMALFNGLPKLPPVTFGPSPPKPVRSPWRASFVRFTAAMSVAVGLAQVLIGLSSLSPHDRGTAFSFVMPIYVLAHAGYAFWLSRQRPPAARTR